MSARKRARSASPNRQFETSRLQRPRPFESGAPEIVETEGSPHPESSIRTSGAPPGHAFSELSTQHSGEPIQRYTAVLDDYKKVFVPTGKKPEDETEQAIYETSLKALVPGATAVDYRSWGSFGLDVMAAGSGYEQQGDIPKYLHSEVPAKKVEFEDEMKVFVYESKSFFKNYQPATERLLLTHKDMKEKGSKLKGYSTSEACVIQSLASLGQSVKDVTLFSGTSSESSPTEATSFHKYAKDAGIDYRTDSQYLRIYTSLGFELKANKPTTWDKIDWASLGNGKYAASTYPTGYSSSAVGHMIAVIVTDDGATLDIRDVQNLTKPKLVGGSKDPGSVGVTYIFKK